MNADDPIISELQYQKEQIIYWRNTYGKMMTIQGTSKEPDGYMELLENIEQLADVIKQRIGEILNGQF